MDQLVSHVISPRRGFLFPLAGLLCSPAFFATPTHAAPTLTLMASSTSVTSGGTVTLSWTTAGARSCWASGGAWLEPKTIPTGTQPLRNLQTTSTYTLTCYDQAGARVTRSVTVTVTAGTTPTLTLTATPDSLTSPQTSSLLRWSGTQLTQNSCRLTGGGLDVSSLPTTSSRSVSPTTTTPYTLSCRTTTSTTLTRTVTVTVIPPPVECPQGELPPMDFDPGAPGWGYDNVSIADGEVQTYCFTVNFDTQRLRWAVVDRSYQCTRHRVDFIPPPNSGLGSKVAYGMDTGYAFYKPEDDGPLPWGTWRIRITEDITPDCDDRIRVVVRR